MKSKVDPKRYLPLAHCPATGWGLHGLDSFVQSHRLDHGHCSAMLESSSVKDAERGQRRNGPWRM